MSKISIFFLGFLVILSHLVYSSDTFTFLSDAEDQAVERLLAQDTFAGKPNSYKTHILKISKTNTPLSYIYATKEEFAACPSTRNAKPHVLRKWLGEREQATKLEEETIKRNHEKAILAIQRKIAAKKSFQQAQTKLAAPEALCLEKSEEKDCQKTEIEDPSSSPQDLTRTPLSPASASSAQAIISASAKKHRKRKKALSTISRQTNRSLEDDFKDAIEDAQNAYKSDILEKLNLPRKGRIEGITTCLLIALKNSQRTQFYDILKMYVDRGYDINELTDKKGLTLPMALADNTKEFLSFLDTYPQVNLNKTNAQKKSVLFYLIEHKNILGLKFVLNQSSCPPIHAVSDYAPVSSNSYTNDMQAETPLQVAIKNNSIEMIDLLLKKDITALTMQDDREDTPFIYALRKQNREIISHLLERYPHKLNLEAKSFNFNVLTIAQNKIPSDIELIHKIKSIYEGSAYEPEQACLCCQAETI